MKENIVHIASVLLLFIFVVAFISSDPSIADENQSSDWISLFDGETLNGWIQKNGTAEYRVEGETIVGRTKIMVAPIHFYAHLTNLVILS